MDQVRTDCVQHPIVKSSQPLDAFVHKQGMNATLLCCVCSPFHHNWHSRIASKEMSFEKGLPR